MEQKKSKSELVRADIIRHIRSHQKFTSAKYLEGLSRSELICHAHPSYRSMYSQSMGGIVVADSPWSSSNGIARFANPFSRRD